MNAGTKVTVNAVHDAAEGNKAQKGIYTVDLSNFVGKATTANATIAIQAGGTTVAKVTVGQVSGLANATSTKAVEIEGGKFVQAAASVTIGGVTFSVSVSGGTITLTMKNDPTSDFTDAMEVTVTGLRSSASLGNQALPGAVTVKQAGILPWNWADEIVRKLDFVKQYGGELVTLIIS